LTSSASKTRYGYAPLQRPGAEVLDDLVERLGESRHLALADPFDPELLHELLDSPGRDAGK
jgi:hypothetical protein